MSFFKDINFILLLLLLPTLSLPAVTLAAFIVFMYITRSGLDAAFDKDFVRISFILVFIACTFVTTLALLVFAYYTKTQEGRPKYIVSPQRETKDDVIEGNFRYLPLSPTEILKNIESSGDDD